MTKNTPKETRARLLRAAVAIVIEQGTAQLTLNAVAHTAQVSKGGLLHHFPTKEALVNGIDDWATQMWSERLEDELAREPEGRAGRWSRAYIRTTFDREPEMTQVLQALTRIIGVYPALLDRWRTMYAQSWDYIAGDGLPQGRVRTIQVACDGLWLSEMIGLPLLPDTEREAMRADLLKLTDERS